MILLIFHAYKELEVRIRNRSGLPNSTVGVSLVRQAFHLTTGPLTDMTVTDRAEREAKMHLFAGALG